MSAARLLGWAFVTGGVGCVAVGVSLVSSEANELAIYTNGWTVVFAAGVLLLCACGLLMMASVRRP
jgi:hypothetical protein